MMLFQIDNNIFFFLFFRLFFQAFAFIWQTVQRQEM